MAFLLPLRMLSACLFLLALCHGSTDHNKDHNIEAALAASIKIEEQEGKLHFSSETGALPKEVPQGTTLMIDSSLPVIRTLTLHNKDDNRHAIPIHSVDHSHDFSAVLAEQGEFCFSDRITPENKDNKTSIPGHYCFHVLPTKLMERENRIITAYKDPRMPDQALVHRVRAGLGLPGWIGHEMTGQGVLIGISNHYESEGLVMDHGHTTNLLFLLQYLVDDISVAMTKEDVLLTLPVTQRLKDYGQRTVSERVSTVMDALNLERQQRSRESAASRKKKEEKAGSGGDGSTWNTTERLRHYQLQLSTAPGSTFDGRLVIELDDEQLKFDTDVPYMLMPDLSDILISVAPLEDGVTGIAVRRALPKGQVRFIGLATIPNLHHQGYDHLRAVADSLSTPIIAELDQISGRRQYIRTHAASEADKSLHNVKVEVNIDSKPAVLPFREKSNDGSLFKSVLTLQDGQCCALEVSKDSHAHVLHYKEEDVDELEDGVQGRALELVDASRLTVTVSEEALKEFAVADENIQDVTFHVRTRRSTVFEEGQYISAHSKIRSMHELWFSAGDLVMAPRDYAWTVCAQWTQIDAKTRHFVRAGSVCADDLYESGAVLLGQASLEDTVHYVESMDEDSRIAFERSVFEEHNKTYTEIVDKEVAIITDDAESEREERAEREVIEIKSELHQDTPETIVVESEFTSEHQRTTWVVSQISPAERRKISTQVLEGSLDEIDELSPLERQEMEALDATGILRLEKHWMFTLQSDMESLKRMLGKTETRDDLAVRRWEGHFANHEELIERTETLREEYSTYLTEEAQNRVEEEQIKRQLDALNEMHRRVEVAKGGLDEGMDNFQDSEIEAAMIAKADLVIEIQQLDQMAMRLQTQIQQEKMVLKDVESSMREAGETGRGQGGGHQ